MNRFIKKIKDKLSELEKNNAITISETVDIINDELMGAEFIESCEKWSKIIATNMW